VRLLDLIHLVSLGSFKLESCAYGGICFWKADILAMVLIHVLSGYEYMISWLEDVGPLMKI
jgi:hypothetical protein